MKRIEQIERMSAQQLEAEAMKMEVRVPQELRADIEAMLAAQQFEGNQTEDRAKRRVSGSSSEQRRRKARRRGFAGNALFDLDTMLEKQILPFLKLGQW